MIVGYLFVRRTAPEAVLSILRTDGILRDIRQGVDLKTGTLISTPQVSPEEAALLRGEDLSLEPIQNGTNRVYHLNPTCNNTAAPDGIAVACVVDPEKGQAYFEARDSYEDLKTNTRTDDLAPARSSTPVRPCAMCRNYRPPTDPRDREWRREALCTAREIRDADGEVSWVVDPIPGISEEDHPDPDDWFSGWPNRIEKARAVCRICPSRVDCDQYGEDSNQEFGVWGDTIPTDRGRASTEYSRNLDLIRDEYDDLRLDLEGVET